MGWHRHLFTIIGAFVVVLGGVALVAPGFYLSLYFEPETAEMAAIGTRRFAPALFALGAVLWLARGMPESSFPAALCLIGAAAFGLVAGTGIHAYMSGLAKSAILLAAVSELVLAVLFLAAWRPWRGMK